MILQNSDTIGCREKVEACYSLFELESRKGVSVRSPSPLAGEGARAKARAGEG